MMIVAPREKQEEYFVRIGEKEKYVIAVRLREISSPVLYMNAGLLVS
jgi:hypothetical protein